MFETIILDDEDDDYGDEVVCDGQEFSLLDTHRSALKSHDPF